MAKVAPFRALRYNGERVGDPGAVWAPPYDVISADAARALRDRHEHNIVRVTLPDGPAPRRYEDAARTLRSWIAEGILVRDERRGVYLHRHRFESRDGSLRVRTGLWAVVELVPLDAGVVLPHERTLRAPKADRLELLRATGTQLSPVFLISSDPKGAIGERWGELTAGEPLERTEFPAAERHELWRVDDLDVVNGLTALFADETLLIADGHHRYETALAYKDELDERMEVGADAKRGEAHRCVLAYLVSERDPGLILDPTHRLIASEAELDWSGALERAAARFVVERVDEGELADTDALLEAEGGEPTFVLVVRGEPGGWRLRLREALTPVASVAFHEIFVTLGPGWTLEEAEERISYTRDADAALEAVRAGDAAAAALLTAPKVSDVRDLAAAGERLPAKTTYFWPKVPTGVAMHEL